MENRNQLLETAYQFLEKNKKASFKDIWKYVKKELNIDEQNEEKVLGNLYTGMVLDTSFFLKSDKLWYPRNAVSLDEIKYQVSSLIEEQESSDEFYSSEDDTAALESDNDEEEVIIVEDSYDDGDIEHTNRDVSDRLDVDDID